MSTMRKAKMRRAGLDNFPRVSGWKQREEYPNSMSYELDHGHGNFTVVTFFPDNVENVDGGGLWDVLYETKAGGPYPDDRLRGMWGGLADVGRVLKRVEKDGKLSNVPSVPQRPRKVRGKKAPKGKYVVRLEAVPNIDFDPLSHEGSVSAGPEFEVVSDSREASKVAKQFIRAYDLGFGNWVGGQVYDDQGEMIARVSYNGRVWGPEKNSTQNIKFGSRAEGRSRKKNMTNRDLARELTNLAAALASDDDHASQNEDSRVASNRRREAKTYRDLVSDIREAQVEKAEVINHAGDKVKALGVLSSKAESELTKELQRISNSIDREQAAAEIVWMMSQAGIDMGDVSSRLVDELEDGLGRRIYPTPWKPAADKTRYTIV